MSNAPTTNNKNKNEKKRRKLDKKTTLLRPNYAQVVLQLFS